MRDSIATATLRIMDQNDSTESAETTLSHEDIVKVARLSRLQLDDAALEAARTDLSAILHHVARIGEVDVEDVAPMPRPLDAVNRLAEDEPGPTLDRAVVLDLAPATEGDFIAVPKVLGEGGA